MKKILNRAAVSFIAMIILCAAFLFACQSVENPFTPGSKTYEKGVLTETSFESEYLDLRFTAPDGYIMATQEDMDELIDFGGETTYVDGNKLNLDYAKAATVYEMMVSAPVGYPNVFVLVEKLLLSNMSVDQYLDSLKDQLLNVDSLDYMISDERVSVKVAGENYTQLSTVIHYPNMPGLEVIQNYLVRKIDNRVLCFIVTYTANTKDKTDTLLTFFTKY